jgi:site-specific recombinase XerD
VTSDLSKSDFDLIEWFCESLAADGQRSPVTIQGYRSDLLGLAKWLRSQNQSIPSAVTSQDLLRRFREKIQKHYRPATINRKLVSIRQFLLWAARHGLVVSPDVERLEGVQKSASAGSWLSSDSQKELIKTVSESGSLRDLVMVQLLLFTGLRMTELSALNWRDIQVDPPDPHLQVRDSQKHAGRKVPLPQEAVDALVRFRELQMAGPSNHVFETGGRPITRRTIQHALNRYAQEAGIKISPRLLRHTFCSNLRESDIPMVEAARRAGVEASAMAMQYALRTDGARTGEPSAGPASDSYHDISLLGISDAAFEEQTGHKIVRSRVPRDFEVRQKVLARAGGKCECCRKEWPKHIFLEVHHLLSAGVAWDQYDNCVAVCPNCHRELHFLESSIELERKLLSDLSSLPA